MGRHARRALASTPIVFGNATTTTTNGSDTVIGYQCTCYRKRCRCGASGVRLLDANSMAQTRMMAMDQSYYGSYGGNAYGCGGRRHQRRRRQGPITALVGGLIGLAIEKHGERKAAREATAGGENEERRGQTTREVEEVDDSSSSENEAELGTQTQGVVSRPEIGERKSSKKGEKKLRKNAVQVQSQRTAEQGQQYQKSENHWESGPPPYSA